MIFALYIVIIMYGQMIATSVATEKSSRAMELLITSAKPVSMMFGKVIAACLAGLIQLIAVFGTGLVCFQLNRSYWKDNQLISSVFDMPVWLLGYMLLFFILGFFIYAFLYGAIGSTASKVEDINPLPAWACSPQKSTVWACCSMAPNQSRARFYGPSGMPEVLAGYPVRNYFTDHGDFISCKTQLS